MNERNIIKKTDENLLKEKILDKMFSAVNTNASLKEVLSTFKKADLDNVRRALEIPGASSLKKAELIDVLNNEIKSTIPSIIGRLSTNEYKLLFEIMRNGGVLKFSEEHLESVLKLRLFGIIITAKINDSEKYLLIPQELRPDLNLLLNDVSNLVACTVNTEPETSEVISIPLNLKEKIGRNVPCPCGSGKKYKRCCITHKLSSVV